jgi:hypothetical protein
MLSNVLLGKRPIPIKVINISKDAEVLQGDKVEPTINKKNNL